MCCRLTNRLPLVLLMFAPMIAWAVQPSSEPTPTPDQFDKLRALIKPHTGEDKWAEIPWTANLWEARQRAAALGKPILLWEMDGNPLGCG